jgi:DNA-binding transcriptional regulator YhcF (GntR family)
MPNAADLNSFLSLPANRGLGVDIAERLRSAILTGYFGPGERLPEEQLAKTMGVSRGPVREALVTLEREGLIVIRRNRGAFVAQLSREDLDEVYSLRVAIERLAVERCVANATEEDIAELQSVVDRIAELMEDGTAASTTPGLRSGRRSTSSSSTETSPTRTFATWSCPLIRPSSMPSPAGIPISRSPSRWRT